MITIANTILLIVVLVQLAHCRRDIWEIDHVPSDDISKKHKR